MAFRNPLTLATLVRAGTFELVDDADVVLARLAEITVGVSRFAGLQLVHDSAGAVASELRWTDYKDPTAPNPVVQLFGPSSTSPTATKRVGFEMYDREAAFADSTVTLEAYDTTTGDGALVNVTRDNLTSQAGAGMSALWNGSTQSASVSVAADATTGLISFLASTGLQLGGLDAYMLTDLVTAASTAATAPGSTTYVVVTGCATSNVNVDTGDLVVALGMCDMETTAATAVGVAALEVGGTIRTPLAGLGRAAATSTSRATLPMLYAVSWAGTATINARVMVRLAAGSPVNVNAISAGVILAVFRRK